MNDSRYKLFTPRVAYKPFEYPQFYEEGWLPQSLAFWLHTKIPMAEDVKDWNENLIPAEKNLVGKILLGFAQSECEIGDYWTTMVAPWFPKHEIKHMAMAFGYFETIHAAAYFYLNETLGLDKDFESFMEDEATAAKVNNLIMVKADKKGDISKFDMALSLATFSAFAEGVSLFSSFAILLSFSDRNLLSGICQQITWSVRDESLHSNKGCDLFNLMVEEIPELRENKELEDKIYAAARNTMLLETNFIDKAFGESSLPNLTKEQLINFMKYRVNNRLMKLNLKSIYDIDKDLLNDMVWFDMAIGGVQKPDFFAVRPTAYSDSKENWDDMDGFDLGMD